MTDQHRAPRVRTFRADPLFEIVDRQGFTLHTSRGAVSLPRPRVHKGSAPSALALHERPMEAHAARESIDAFERLPKLLEHTETLCEELFAQTLSRAGGEAVIALRDLLEEIRPGVLTEPMVEE